MEITITSLPQADVDSEATLLRQDILSFDGLDGIDPKSAAKAAKWAHQWAEKHYEAALANGVI